MKKITLVLALACLTNAQADSHRKDSKAKKPKNNTFQQKKDQNPKNLPVKTVLGGATIKLPGQRVTPQGNTVKLNYKVKPDAGSTLTRKRKEVHLNVPHVTKETRLELHQTDEKTKRKQPIKQLKIIPNKHAHPVTKAADKVYRAADQVSDTVGDTVGNVIDTVVDFFDGEDNQASQS
jgi:hypothetical protein